MDQPKNNPGTLAAEHVTAEPYTDRGNGTREETNEARGRAVTDGRPWLERVLVPALLSGMLVVAGSFAIQVSMEMGEIKGQLGEVKGRLDGVDQRIDGLRADMNDRLGRIEALLLAQRGRPSDPGR